MHAAVATTVSPDCDRRLRLAPMRMRASRAVLRLEARVSFAWLSRCGEAVFTQTVIFGRFGELRMAAAAAGEGVHHALRGVGEEEKRAGEPPVRLGERAPREREQDFAAREERRGAHRVAVIEKVAPLHNYA